jgi:trehalose 6-phosphate phosphatase
LVAAPAGGGPCPAARRAIARLAAGRHTRVAVLSGRPAADVAALLGDLALPIAGEHGWELRFADGGRLAHPVAPALVERLDRAQRAAAALAPARLERKRTALVVHTRGLPPAVAGALAEEARALLGDWLEDGRFALRPIDGGVELRLTGRDKGTALAELAARAGRGTFVVAVGDDDTDEDAFRAAARLGGWGVRVGQRRDSAARAFLASPAAVAAFLEEWAERLDGVLADATTSSARGSR